VFSTTQLSVAFRGTITFTHGISSSIVHHENHEILPSVSVTSKSEIQLRVNKKSLSLNPIGADLFHQLYISSKLTSDIFVNEFRQILS
jgi:hypothetical protein